MITFRMKSRVLTKQMDLLNRRKVMVQRLTLELKPRLKPKLAILEQKKLIQWLMWELEVMQKKVLGTSLRTIPLTFGT